MTEEPARIQEARSEIARVQRRGLRGYVPVGVAVALGLVTLLGQTNGVLPDEWFATLMLTSGLGFAVAMFSMAAYHAALEKTLVPSRALLTAWETQRAAQVVSDETRSEVSAQAEIAGDPRWVSVVRVTDELMRLAPEGRVHDDVTAARAELSETIQKLRALEAIAAEEAPGSRLGERRGALVETVGSRFLELLESLQELHLELVAHSVGAGDPTAIRVHDLVARSVAAREVETAAADASLRRARQAASKPQRG